MSKEDIKKALSYFSIEDKSLFDETTVVPITGGHLHDSYRVFSKKCEPGFIIQRLNNIFDLNAINNNLKFFEKAQDDAFDQLPSYWKKVEYVNSLNGKEKIYIDDKNNAWRLMRYVDNDIFVFDSFSQIEKDKRSNAARSFGESLANFGKILSLIPGCKLKEPLPNFHNTMYHYNYLLSILSGKSVPLSLDWKETTKVSADLKFMKKYFYRINKLVGEAKNRKNLIESLYRVESVATHGDPKLNNAIFVKDPQGNLRCVCLIDLDTIQLGTALDDLGDALRSAGNIAGEEPNNLSDIKIDCEIIENISKGYFSKTEYYFSKATAHKYRKYENKAQAKFLYELGLRFLADALVGNKYFKIKVGEKPDLNLFRAEVQFETLKKLERTC